MAELKTQRTSASVTAWLNAIEDEGRRRDAKKIVKLMRDVTGAKPSMWGDSIVGFGSYDYEYASGHSGTTCVLGFANRKQDLTLYGLQGVDGADQLLERLGRHRRGKGCLYLKRLDDVDLDVLEQLVRTVWTAHTT